MHLRWCEKRKNKEESGVVNIKKKKERDTSFQTTESEDDVEGDEMLIDAEDNDEEYENDNENENDESVEEEEEEEGEADNLNENEEEDNGSEDEDDDDDLDKWALDDPTAISSSPSSSFSPSSSKPAPAHVLLQSAVKTDETTGTYSSISDVRCVAEARAPLTREEKFRIKLNEIK